MNIIVVGAGSAGLMTAILCKKYYSVDVVNVKIVQSGKVPILGVGEGTTEHIQLFIKYSGIDEVEFIKESKATLKAGVLFKDWKYEGHEYVHSLANYHVEGTEVNGSKEYLVPYFMDGIPLKGYAGFLNPEKDYPKSLLEGKLEAPTLQYHFNNFALNDYLRKKCDEFGIEIIDDFIEDIEFDEHSNIKSIIGTDRHEADLFFDCSGFKRLLISKYNPEFVDYSDQLIVDRALFFPYKTQDNPLPLTLSKAMKYGWFWQAPTQDRTGNGYVYSSKHCTPEMVLDEVRSLGFELPDETVNNIKTFKSGHLKESWIKNCVAIGVASSFFEPMEAAALSGGILQTISVLEYLGAYDSKNDYVQRIYNNHFEKFYDNAFQFIRLHYEVDRDDTSFWKEYKDMTLPQSLSDKIELYKRRPADWNSIGMPMWLCLYGPYNFMQVMSGLGLLDVNEHLDYLYTRGLLSELHRNEVELMHQNRNGTSHIEILRNL